MDPPGSSPRPAAWHSRFQGFKQRTPGNQMVGKGTPPDLGKEKSFISFPCIMLDRTVPW